MDQGWLETSGSQMLFCQGTLRTAAEEEALNWIAEVTPWSCLSMVDWPQGQTDIKNPVLKAGISQAEASLVLMLCKSLRLQSLKEDTREIDLTLMF